uniref:diguanylate cyclase n=1 Tax=Candidatus Kentrum sp. FW TaxID=2126338 RepID=A0A450SUY2_9GAMM|nr:MAG: diguanylate cyclase (GGDEF) domain-containing protein [Candidatus Kentron sp. FW]
MGFPEINSDDPSNNSFPGPVLTGPHALERTQPVLLVIAGMLVGKLFPLDKKPWVTIGCAEDCDIRFMQADISPRHARLELNEGNAVITDLGTINGTYVDGIAVSRHGLADGAIIRIGSIDILKFTYINQLERSFYSNQYRKTVYDDLTGVFNRRYFLMALGQELAYAHRHSQTAALILIDIDHFKRINDGQGHLVGDTVLRRIVSVIQKNLRKENILARYGGEEFGIILRGGDAWEAHGLADRIRCSVGQTGFDHGGKSFHITISAGIAIHDREHAPGGALEIFTEADKQLYRAKAAGGNHVSGNQ